MKKLFKPGKTKLVRIDHKTEIEVSVDIPDDVARKEYLEKLQPRKNHIRKPNQKK
jgi:hypothetical protein